LVEKPADAVAVLLYVGNWVPALTSYHLGGINHTWSLAVEEQFYLLWPLAVVAARRRWVLAAGAVAGCVWAVGARLVLWDGGFGGDRVYYGSDTHADALLVGCLLAIWLRGRAVPRMPGWLAVSAAGVCLVFGWADEWFGFVWVPAFVPVLTVVLLLAAVGPSAPGWLLGRPLRGVGRRAYGIYLWHFPLAWTLPDEVSWWSVPLGLAVTAVVVEVSWRYVEQPFLRLKGRATVPRQARAVMADA
jgi:peptidoglycan/LPS O-acetylase OafA/YrhL